MNVVFGSAFEESMEDLYFGQQSMLILDFHFAERRPVNIADTHGEISIDTLNQISILFNGFLIHVECIYLCSNEANVIKYLKSLPSQSYIQLLIRDVRAENDGQLTSSVNRIQSTCSNCRIFYLPNVTDKASRQSKAKINKLCESIFKETAVLQCFEEKSIQRNLEHLLDKTEKQIVEQDKTFIERIRPVLINGKIDDYPLYCLFMDMCKKRSEIAKMDPYGRDFRSENSTNLMIN